MDKVSREITHASYMYIDSVNIVYEYTYIPHHTTRTSMNTPD